MCHKFLKSVSAMPYEELKNSILVKAKNGDVEAFEEIVNRYERPIYTFIYKFLQHPQDAADLTQVTFIKVYKHIHRYDTDKKFSTWIFTIARRTTYDELRKRRREKNIYIAEYKDSEEYNIDIEFETSDRSKAIHAKIDIEEALSKIKQPYSDILRMYYWEGYQYKDIALILKKPLNTVKSLVFRAKKYLKNQL